MPTVEHSTLTSTNLHEPKGIDSASSGEVYVSDGAGSGSWTARRINLSTSIVDVSTSDTIYLPIPYAGTVSKVVTTIDGAIATSDATVTVRNSSGSSMGTVTITQSGSAAGDTDSLSPSSNNTVTDNDYITIETDGASTNTVSLSISVTVELN